VLDTKPDERSTLLDDGSIGSDERASQRVEQGRLRRADIVGLRPAGTR
jgi:hypothetical protein